MNELANSLYNMYSDKKTTKTESLYFFFFQKIQINWICFFKLTQTANSYKNSNKLHKCKYIEKKRGEKGKQDYKEKITKRRMDHNLFKVLTISL